MPDLPEIKVDIEKLKREEEESDDELLIKDDEQEEVTDRIRTKIHQMKIKEEEEEEVEEDIKEEEEEYEVDYDIKEVKTTMIFLRMRKIVKMTMISRKKKMIPTMRWTRMSLGGRDSMTRTPRQKTRTRTTMNCSRKTRRTKRMVGRNDWANRSGSYESC